MGNKKKELKDPQRNVEVNDRTWQNTSILAAQLGTTKKEVVRQALDHWYNLNKN